MNIVIVIPTYNEAENIKRLIPSLFSTINEIKNHKIDVLVVDDSSPDGTGAEVLKLSKEFPNLHLLSKEKKEGLGAAYIYAFKRAMSDYNAEVIVEMDADLQHDPKDVRKLVTEIDNGFDYVVGSRFIKGGSIPDNWALYRKILSWGGNIFSKIVLWVFDVNDFTSGFCAFRVKGFFEKIDLDTLLSKGFAYKIDLMYKMHKLGAKTIEIPIIFGLRDRGDSKMEKNNLVDSLMVVIKIRARESKSFLRFLVVGIAGLFTDMGLFNILRLGLLTSRYASAFSGFIAIFVTYTLNNNWSFSERKISTLSKTLKSLVIYYIFSYIPVVFRSWLIGFSVRIFGDSFLVANSAFFVGVVVGLVWNFTVYSKIIWRINKRSQL
jgi:dolichol-phosphate mannosyltransferase